MSILETEHGVGEDEKKTEAFEDQQEIMGKIRELGFAKYTGELPQLADAFDLEKHRPSEKLHRCVCCMDERIPYGLHAAGSGILLSDKDFDAYVKESGIDSISSHDGCGAGKIYAEKMGLDVNDSDRIAREWAEKKAKEKGLAHVHLGVEKPFHFARACYYDGTGRLNYDGVEGLPAGFVVGRKYMSKESSLAEVKVAIKIIFGHHGYGEELLNKENPFLLVAVSETAEGLEKLKEELTEAAESFGESVVIDGFVAPKI